MVAKTLNFVRFEPSLWDGLVDPSPLLINVLDVAETAPEGAGRNQLRTKVNLHPSSPNDAFDALTATHDTVVQIKGAYVPSDDDDDDTDELQDRFLVRPKDFNIFEFKGKSGQIYANMPLTHIKKMSHRHKQTAKEDGQSGSTLNLRLVSLPNLETALKHATTIAVTVVGYGLDRVLLSTPVTRLDVLAEEIETNTEMQDAKGKAENMRTLMMDVAVEDELVRVRIGENGAAYFRSYPGDGLALTVLEILEPFIDSHSDTMLE